MSLFIYLFFVLEEKKGNSTTAAQKQLTNPPESGTHNIRQTAEREEGTGVTVKTSFS